MQIRVSEIPDDGLRLIDPAALGAGLSGPGLERSTPSISWSSGTGDKVSIAGRFEATAQLACSRCLDAIVAHGSSPRWTSSSCRRRAAATGRPSSAATTWRWTSIVRTSWTSAELLRSETDLALPMKPLCRPDCRGLCPVCGGNKNVTECRCETRGTDPRLAPLEALRRLQ